MNDHPDRTVAIDLARLVQSRGGRAPRSPRPVIGWLVPLDGPMKHRDFRVLDGKTTVGTAADCDIVLLDPWISGHHCVLTHHEGNVALTDLDSVNGTWWNGQRVHRTPLINNDTLRLGRTTVLVKLLF